jgi:hypothetical protein
MLKYKALIQCFESFLLFLEPLRRKDATFLYSFFAALRLGGKINNRTKFINHGTNYQSYHEWKKYPSMTVG